MNKRNKIKTGYIQTEIGRIPKEWKVVTLDEIVKEDKFAIVDGPFGTQLHSNEYMDSGIPLIRVNNINKDGLFNFEDLVYISEIKFEKLKRSAVYPGDILLAKTGATIGKVTIFPGKFEKGLIASSCAKISIDENKADIIYIFYFILSDLGYKQILASSTGATRPTINLTPISKIIIFLPPFPEQQKIAEILSTVDQAIEKVDDSIAKTERLKKGLMQELLTKGIGHKEFKDTEIGRIPKEWEVVRLKESKEIDLIMGQSPPGKSYNKKGEGLPFIQGKAEFGNMYPSPILWTTQPTKIAEEGDILISVRAPVGDVNICPYRLCIGRGLAAIRIKEGSNIFYFYWFQKEKQRIESIGKGSTFKAITKDELSNIFIPFPSLPEQQKIAEILSTVDKRLELLRNKKEKMERVKKGLMNDLLTGKKRVVL